MIVIQNVTKAFNGLQAVDRLSLEVPAGQIYGLLGPNGAGKSTTLNMVLGFVKPDAGKALVDGIDSWSRAADARQLIGYVPENVTVYPYLRGIENLEYFCALAGKRYSRAERAEFLSACGLSRDVHDMRLAAYSKGMRQKLGIAIAHAKQARAYVLDEPDSGLDPVASRELTALLRSIAAGGSAVLMASHDIFRVRETCSRIGILRHGSLVREVSAADVTAHELESIYVQHMQD